jgi:hypothetical protein
MQNHVFFSSGALLLAFANSTKTGRLESMTLATQIGDLIASEEICGLKHDQNAIEVFIDNNVAADDLSFVSMLDTMTGGAEFTLKDMSQGQKTAHCRQIERVAKSLGFSQ